MHHQGFERLIRAMDDAAAHLNQRVVMQIGASTFEPVHAEWFRFADQVQIEKLYSEASTIISHAGAGTIIGAFRYNAPLIVVPRRASEKEHVDDHQSDLARVLSEQGKVVLVSEPTPESLIRGIETAVTAGPQTTSSAALTSVVESILNSS